MSKILCILLLLIAITSVAAPAAWYKWRSNEDGSYACSQTPMGEGWELFDGPFKDVQCMVKGQPG